MGYKIGKIYRIYKIDDPTINYIGSTFTTLRQRFMKHKGNSNEKRWKRASVICEYLKKYDKNDFKIILLKQYLVYAETQKDTKHLRAYEQLWINKFRLKKNCINKCNPLNIKRFYKNNYYINNKEKIIKYQHNYNSNENNKKKISLTKKIYREKNIDKIKKQKKEYYKKNKEKICKSQNQKIECPLCKSIVGKNKLNRHQKTKKCISLSKK